MTRGKGGSNDTDSSVISDFHHLQFQVFVYHQLFGPDDAPVTSAIYRTRSIIDLTQRRQTPRFIYIIINYNVYSFARDM